MRRLWGAVVLSIVASIAAAQEVKVRLLVVDSYHPEYTSSQYVYKGFCRTLLELGYLDREEDVTACRERDEVETSHVLLKRLWMDTKRRSTKEEITDATIRVMKEVAAFRPALVFLGDDNATKQVGAQLLDSQTPVVFWGLKSSPLKHGVVDSMERPNHNMTGVYQAGYHRESLQLLKTIIPGIKTFAVLADNTEVGRAYTKSIEVDAQEGRLPLTLVEVVTTGEFEVFKQKALELQEKVDAFYAGAWAGMKDAQGQSVPREEVAQWYLAHVRKPEAAGSRQYLDLGLLCGADDSRAQQGVEAARIAHDLLRGGRDPATYPPRAPARGALMANRQRAERLGIVLTPAMGIEEIIER